MKPRICTFHDGLFRFYTAHYLTKTHHKYFRIVFRVRMDTTPEVRAHEKGIKNYDFLAPALPSEIAYWCKTHPSYPIIKMTMDYGDANTEK